MNDALLKMVKLLGSPNENEAGIALRKLRERKFSFVDLVANLDVSSPLPPFPVPRFAKEYEYEVALADLEEQKDTAWAEVDRLQQELRASYLKTKTPPFRVSLLFIGRLVLNIELVVILTTIAIVILKANNQKLLDHTVLSIESSICRLKSSGCSTEWATEVSLEADVPSRTAKTRAPDSSATLRAAILTAITKVDCVLVGGDLADGRVKVEGVAESSSAAQLSTAVAQRAASLPADIRVSTFHGPFCGLLDILRPLAVKFGQGGSQLQIGPKADGFGQQRSDGYVTPHIAMPSWSAYLIVDDFRRDGGVTHLYPVTLTEKEKQYQGHMIVTLSKSTQGTAVWQFDVPSGTDTIVAIASTRPLFATLPPNSDSAAVYLGSLNAALIGATRRGDQLSVSATVAQSATP